VSCLPDQDQVLGRTGVSISQLVHLLDFRQVVANADQLPGFPVTLCREVEDDELGLDRGFGAGGA
jgi:hypothetical protein